MIESFPAAEFFVYACLIGVLLIGFGTFLIGRNIGNFFKIFGALIGISGCLTIIYGVHHANNVTKEAKNKLINYIFSAKNSFDEVDLAGVSKLIIPIKLSKEMDENYQQNAICSSTECDYTVQKYYPNFDVSYICFNLLGNKTIEFNCGIQNNCKLTMKMKSGVKVLIVNESTVYLSNN